MTPEKIELVVYRYEQYLYSLGFSPKRMDTSKSIKDLTEEERFRHVLHLCSNVKRFLHEEDSWGKTNRHFAALQMILSSTGLYTLEELLEHNRA